MSVLKAHRSESKAEFVNTANKIYVETINFLSRLSARFSRLMANDVSHLASEVLVNAEKANSIFPSDHTRKELRKQHLLESRAALMALDVELSHCYVQKAIREKNWSKVLDMVMNLMQTAETKFETGAERKEWVLAMVKASADTIDYDIDMDAISDLIDSLCNMSKVVNAPKA